jgi:threonylcarbamoyladenosine tRNA methylthiotransferase MtaB
MPQVERALVKDRARRLREKGETALRHYLDGQIGMQQPVLTESRGMARSEQFTPVRLARDVQPGTILHVTITGHDGRHLLAA